MQPEQPKSSLITWISTGSCCCVVGAFFLLPIFFPRHEKAYTANCMSNEKQMGVGLQMYVQDYDEHFPPAPIWMDVSSPYVKNQNAYHCPLASSSGKSTGFGYGFNASLSLKSLESYKKPDGVLMLYDANDLRWNANALGRTGAANPPRHVGGDIFTFIDGHTKWKRVAAQNEQ